MLDSLLKQNIAVLTAAIFGALSMSLLLIAALVLSPQIARTAADTGQLVRSLELSFAQMDPFQQILFAEALRADEAPDVLVSDTAPEDRGSPRTWFAQSFLRVLSERHGIAAPDVLIDGAGRVWVRIETADQPYWLSLRALPDTDPILSLALALGIALLAALAGGVALQRRIAGPLKRLEDAVGRISGPTDVYDSDIDRPREIAAVSRALAQLSQRLQAAEADRSLMLAGVSHDLRTPLTKLRLTLAMLGSADPELVAGAERNVIRIETMLGQFLDFARGFEAEATAAVALRPLLQQAIDAQAAPGDGAVALEAPGEAVVRVKPAALRRAVENLLANALRYGAAPVSLRAWAEGPDLSIAVHDAGPGIPPDEAGRLLRPFARGDAARGGEGTGLGLAIVQQVAQAHGGAVRLVREDGGFTARLVLPGAAGSEALAPGGGVADRPPGR